MGPACGGEQPRELQGLLRRKRTNRGIHDNDRAHISTHVSTHISTHVGTHSTDATSHQTPNYCTPNHRSPRTRKSSLSRLLPGHLSFRRVGYSFQFTKVNFQFTKLLNSKTQFTELKNSLVF